ncbi:MAG: hypothetical protein ACRDYX_21005 [Egibacteraceae bacterium]
MTVVPEEAELLREAAARFLDGESLRSIAGDWTGRGLATTDGTLDVGSALPGAQVPAAGRTAAAPRRAAPRHVGPGLPRGRVARPPARPGAEPLPPAGAAPLGRAAPPHRPPGLRGVRQPHARQQGPAGSKLRYACRPDTGCGRVSIVAAETERAAFEAVAGTLDDERARATAAGEDEARRREVERELGRRGRR